MFSKDFQMTQTRWEPFINGYCGQLSGRAFAVTQQCLSFEEISRSDTKRGTERDKLRVSYWLERSSVALRWWRPRCPSWRLQPAKRRSRCWLAARRRCRTRQEPTFSSPAVGAEKQHVWLLLVYKCCVWHIPSISQWFTVLNCCYSEY